MNNLIGKTIDRYHILEQLGEGGMAIVYKAYDTRLERDVAIKIIRTDVFGSSILDRILKRFEREAKSLAKLSHPNIVKVHDYGDYEGSPYLVLEYLPAGTLKERLGKPIPWQEAVRILIPIAEALEYAHEHNIVHRDIKPSNILLTEKGQPMLTDFGIAKILENEDAATLTGTGLGVGTPEYMSPEQWTGSATAQSDIYSLGVVLYEMLTGRKPYTADTPAAILLKQATEPLPRPNSYVSDLPDSIEKVLLKALARNPKDRYQNAGALVEGLENLLIGTNKSREFATTPKMSKPVEPNLDTRDTYLQEETYSTRLQTETYDEIPRKTQSTHLPVQSQRKNNFRWAWIIGVIGIFGFMLYMIFRQGTVYVPTAIESPVIFEVPATTEAFEIGSTTTGNDGMTLLYVPAGEFTMGSDTSNSSNEKPVHTVYLDAFWIDQTEVTNELFSSFISSTGYKTDAEKAGSSYVFTGPNLTINNGADWQHPTGPESDISSRDKHPVTHVSWNDAVAYCKWADRRLPTEAEWEKAARGTNERTYPWGNVTPNNNLLNFNNSIGETTEVGNYPNGVSPYGAYDMAGNIGEWVNDWYSETYYQNSPSSNPLGPNSGQYRTLRGGSWNDDVLFVRSTFRGESDPDGTNIGGFRCARSE